MRIYPKSPCTDQALQQESPAYDSSSLWVHTAAFPGARREEPAPAPPQLKTAANRRQYPLTHLIQPASRGGPTTRSGAQNLAQPTQGASAALGERGGGLTRTRLFRWGRGERERGGSGPEAFNVVIPGSSWSRRSRPWRLASLASSSPTSLKVLKRRWSEAFRQLTGIYLNVLH
jgi:hypothetical protein